MSIGFEDLGDFIVSDSEDEEGGAQAGNRNIPRKKRVYTDDAQQEAIDIFGVNAEELGMFNESDENDEDIEEDENEEDMEGIVDDDEADEEYGEDELERVRKKQTRQRRLKAKHRIEEIFEPAELEKNLLTEYDQQIRLEDKPERFMLRKTPVTSEPNENELEKEAEWIYKQLYEQKTSVSVQDAFTPKPQSVIIKIRDVLSFIRNQFLEVPFILQYRKEHISVRNVPELVADDLWKIYEMDEKYCQLKERKENLIKLLKRMQNYQFEKLRSHTDPSISNLQLDDAISAQLFDMIRTLEDTDIDRLRNVQTNEEFLDCYQHFKLYYACDIEEMRDKEKNSEQQSQQGKSFADESRNLKNAKKKDRYHMCKLAGLNSLAKKFGLSAEQFGENVASDFQKHEIDQWNMEPVLLAQDFINDNEQSTMFVNTDQVLSAARFMVATQIARDPNVKSYVRDVFYKRACISVKPTPKGVKEIDENHQCYAFKYLKQKPCISLKYDEYLKLSVAEQDGLLEMKFDVDSDEAIKYAQLECDKLSQQQTQPVQPEEEEDFEAPPPVAIQSSNPLLAHYQTIANLSTRQTIFEKLKSFFQKDEFSYNVEQWNLQRSQIINETLYKILFPELEKELRSKLLNEAKQFVIQACKSQLNEWLNVMPFKTETFDVDNDSDGIYSSGLRVFVIGYSTDFDNPVSICACIKGNGELDEFIRLRRLNVRTRFGGAGNVTAANEKVEDFEKLKEFIILKKPNVIAVSAENKDALYIIDELRELVKQIESSTQMATIPVELVDNELSKLYSVTKTAENEFREQPAMLKQCICIARYLQDPLLAYSQLCNYDNDILALKYHPLQDLISKDELMNALECEFVNITNSVGVDLNRCLACPHTSNVLQFVSGLGPRKSNHIVRMAKHKMPIISRMFLVTECTLGSKVFINCAGFIKFDVDNLSKVVEDGNDETRFIEVLDSTRIHPEAYEWARKMAIDALDIDDANSAIDSANSALKEILESPDRLKDLDLDAFAAELLRTGLGNKAMTLYDIRTELYNRFQDQRVAYRSPASKEKFHMLTKETPQTFYTGSSL